MPDPVVGGIMVGSQLLGGVLQAKSAGRATSKAAKATEATALRAEELNRERFAGAEALMQPSIARSETAGQQLMGELGLPGADGTVAAPSNAYMQTGGYQDLLSESLGAVEQTAATSGSTLYGGRRLAEAGKVGGAVQQSYYNNYMNMLQNMSSPASATNLASMGVGQGATIGSQNIASTGMANEYRLEGTAAKNAAIGDVMGGATNVFTGAMKAGYI